MKIFILLCIVLLQCVYAMDDEFDRDLLDMFGAAHQPPQSIREKCKYIWYEVRLDAERDNKKPKQYRPDLKKKLQKEIGAYTYRSRYDEWFLPFIDKITKTPDVDMTNYNMRYVYSTEIKNMLQNPSNFMQIGGSPIEVECVLEYVARLNESLNSPLISLSDEVDKRNIYATVVCRMQDSIWPISWVSDRRAIDHAGLVFEFFEAGRWDSVYVDYKRDKTSGNMSGGSGYYVVKSQDKSFAYSKVLWNYRLGEGKDEDYRRPTPTQVDYFRYATFMFPFTQANKKKLDNIRLNRNFNSETGYDGERYSCTDHTYCCHPYPYSTYGGKGYDNCCTYAARLLELFAGVSNGGVWPERPFNPQHYKKNYSFDANDLRRLIDSAQVARGDCVVLCPIIHPNIKDSYLIKSKATLKMKSFPEKLYEKYYKERKHLMSILDNSDSKALQEELVQSLSEVNRVLQISLTKQRDMIRLSTRKPRFMVDNQQSEYSDPSIKHNMGEFAQDLRLNNKLMKLVLKDGALSGIAQTEMVLFSEALCDNKALTLLDLSNNNLGSKLIESLKDMFCFHNRTLTTLFLSQNSIDSVGARVLSKIIRFNEILEILNLSNNNIGNEGVQWLSSALKKNARIKELNLKHNAIDNSGARFLYDMLEDSNRSIKKLDLEDNDIDQFLLDPIQAFVMRNHAL